jgi:hypothetical protein
VESCRTAPRQRLLETNLGRPKNCFGLRLDDHVRLTTHSLVHPGCVGYHMDSFGLRRGEKSSSVAWFKAVENTTMPKWRDIGLDPSLATVTRAQGLAPGPRLLEETRVSFHDPADSLQLLDLMCVHWLTLASDPKDKIYALVGIAADCRIRQPAIDYSGTEKHACVKAVKFLLDTRKNLDIICYSHPVITTGGLLSWAPNWQPKWDLLRDTSLYLARTNVRYKFTAARTTNAIASISFDPKRWGRKQHKECIYGPTEGAWTWFIDFCHDGKFKEVYPLQREPPAGS